MESFLIKGGVPLHGEVTISGSKNAALPIMAAALLTGEPCVIRGVPDLSDTRFMAQILASLGAVVKFERGTLTVRAQKIRGYADYELVRKMRGSICIMGPLLGRLKQARVSLPGGCVIGARPINLHLKGFEALGAKITIRRRLCQRHDKTTHRRANVSGRTRGFDRAGHGECDDGGGAGRRRNGHRKRGVRTGSGGSGELPECDGRKHFGRRQSDNYNYRR